MTALASAEAIEVIAGTHTAVKWPNDLLIGDSKVGGILCESGTDVQSRPFQVIGIGVNVNGTPADFPENLRGPATTIRHGSGRFIDRNKLVAQLLHELEVCIEEYVSGGFERVSHAYRQRCSTIGKTVRAILTDGKEFVGLAETIGKDGSLRVVQRRVPPDQRPPRVRELRAADIIHLRS